MSVILAIDLGGTRYRAGIASTADPAAVEMVGEWPAPRSREDFLSLLRGQLARYGATRLGMGIPGLAHGTVATWVPNLGYLDDLDLAAELPGVAIGLGNDAQLAMLAEAKAGTARDMDDALLLAIGTGIGSAVLAGGRIVAGARGAACSFGWAVADCADEGNDRSGWLERQASGRSLDAVAQSIGLGDGEALVAAVRQGNEAARAGLVGPMTSLGTTLAGAVALLDPEAVILAGGVVRSFDIIAPMILPTLRRHLPPHLRTIELRAGHFGSRAGLIGAAFAGAAGPEWRKRHA